MFVWTDKDPINDWQRTDVNKAMANIIATGIPARVVDWRSVPGVDVEQAGNSGGWYAQQIVKLRASINFAQTENVLILDTKNVPLKTIGKDLFLDNCNRAASFGSGTVTELGEPHEEWVSKAKTLPGMETTHHENMVGHSITPFVFNTQTLKNMVQRVESSTGNSIEYNIVVEGQTEFAMYSAYVRSSLQSVDCEHFFPGKGVGELSPMLWGTTPEWEAIPFLEDAASDGRRHFFGFQKMWAEEAPYIKDNFGSISARVRKIYQNAGLISEEDRGTAMWDGCLVAPQSSNAARTSLISMGAEEEQQEHMEEERLAWWV